MTRPRLRRIGELKCRKIIMTGIARGSLIGYCED